jgi:uncharacterized protein YacL
MNSGLVLRIIGMIVLGLVGWGLGSLLAGDAPAEQYTLIVVALTLAGVVVGGLVTPWALSRPTQHLQRRIQQLPAQELLAIVIGLIVGLFIAVLLAPILVRFPSPLGELLPLVCALFFGYLGASVMSLRHKDLFALISKSPSPDSHEPRGGKPVLLDTSVIIDGRIADISQTGFISGAMLVPRFVLNELQHIADSSDALRRNRGRRGLDMLNRLKEESIVPVQITDLDVPEAREVDDKLVMLAKTLDCAVVTNDYNLNRVAQLQGVPILNINELANAVKWVLLPGETISVQVIQEGKEWGQGIGYLDDGTMIVIEEGRPYIGQTIRILVKKVLQKAEGRLVFAQPQLDR